jgi:hypothetical protein
MGTRGYVGIRNNDGLLTGRFNHWDSYYTALGTDAVELYFDGKGNEILEIADNKAAEDKEFLYDGLFCEFAYIYNKENDTLEVYRGFFKNGQELTDDKREKIVHSLERGNGNEYFCHLIFIIDKNKHTKEQVLQAFEKYDNTEEAESNEKRGYPERDIIKLEVPKGYNLIV